MDINLKSKPKRGESATEVVLQPAKKAAEEELAIERETLLPSDLFDTPIAALDDGLRLSTNRVLISST